MAATSTSVRFRFWLLAGLAALTAVSAGAAGWYFRAPAVHGPLRVGFRNSPPFYFVGPGGEAQGLAVVVVDAAAKRSGVEVRWVQLHGPADDALRAGTIDIWPTFPVDGPAQADYISEPWLESLYYLLYRLDGPIRSAADTPGRLVSALPGLVSESMASRALPGARLLFLPTSADRIVAICTGQAHAGFLEGREIQAVLLSRPDPCSGVSLAFSRIDGAQIQYGIGAVAAARHGAQRLRDEIDAMSSDGTLGRIHADWSLNTTNETRLVFALQEARLRGRVTAFGALALALALAAALWLGWRSRQARHLAEEYARQQERYRVLFERNLAGVYRTTVEGRFLDCNDAFARMLGCPSRHDLLARDVWDFYHERAARDTMLAALREHGTVTNQETVVRRADGRTAVLLESATLIDAGDGSHATIEGTVIDVTQLRDLEDQYRQAQKLESIGRLAGGVAHDFNNTLTAVSGYTEMVLAGLDAGDPAREMMLEIQKATNHAETLTRQLLAFSRRQHLQPKVISLNSVLADIRSLLQRVIGEDVELVTDLAPELGAVKADPGQIQQVIMNLAVNARDAMPGGGRLTIATTNADVGAEVLTEPGAVTGPCVRLRVSDTGYGMDQATLGRVFEPFFTTKERGKGTGLGLATVYGIVKQSGGHIRIRSLPGSGTTFEVDLPRIDEPLSEADRPVAGPALRGAGTILVVEDQDDVRRLVAESLRRYGYNVLDAAHGDAAVQLCRAHPGPLALLLLDVVMPGMNGPAVARACLEIRPGVKVLYMSGYTDNALQKELGGAAPPAYIQKPFTPVQLAEKVKDVLGG